MLILIIRFRARGPHIHRKMDLDQRPRGPIGNKDDPYFDPNEDPSYSFGFKTNTYEKQEDANRRGDVTGRKTVYLVPTPSFVLPTSYTLKSEISKKLQHGFEMKIQTSISHVIQKNKC